LFSTGLEIAALASEIATDSAQPGGEFAVINIGFPTGTSAISRRDADARVEIRVDARS
jgi:hypothetical protein